MDITVYGAGVAGSIFTSMARLRGHEVRLISEGQPSSAAALAVMRRSWCRVQTDAALDWYRLNATIRAGAETTWEWKSDRKYDPDYYLIDPAEVLLTPDVRAAYPEIVAGPTLRVFSRPVWDSGPPASYGATAVSLDARVLGDAPLRVHWLRPYHAILAGQVGDTVRLGSSVSPTPQEAIERVHRMIEQAEGAQMVTRGTWDIVSGKRYPLTATEYGLDYIALGGLGRLGFAYAPWMAGQVLRTLEAADAFTRKVGMV